MVPLIYAKITFVFTISAAASRSAFICLPIPPDISQVPLSPYPYGFIFFG